MNPPHPLSHGVRALTALVVTACATLAVATGPALAANCGKQVVDDWYDNGRVDTIYPLSCYREAIQILPVDLLDYSNAKEEIGRALAFAKQGKNDPGDKPDPGETPTPATTPVTETGRVKSPPATTGATQTAPSQDPVDTGTGTLTEAAPPPGNSSDPSSVPLPLIVLGGLAVLLLAAGSAGYLARRANARKGGDGPPPASA